MNRRQIAEGRRQAIRLRNMGRAAVRKGLVPSRSQVVATYALGHDLHFMPVRMARMAASDLRGMPIAA